MIRLSGDATDIVRQVVGSAHMATGRMPEREARVYQRLRSALMPCLGCGAEHLAVDLSVGDAHCPLCRCHGEGETESNTTGRSTHEPL